tara:strand:- start:185 stop:940 length:756 start_codon:yes stop_codon:yes gene_type:complete
MGRPKVSSVSELTPFGPSIPPASSFMDGVNNLKTKNMSINPAMLTPQGMAAAGAAQAVGGVVKAVGSLFGGGKRRREQRAAQQELATRKAEYEGLDTSNPYKNLTNTYENLTVNTQAADFAAQQSSQGAANIMGNLAAAAGGGGVAALAQSLANSQAQAAQQASVAIGQQEQRNAMLGAQGEQQRQQAVATGERQSQKMNMEKTGTLLGMAQQRKAAADQARKDATDALVGGIADVGAGAAMGAFGKNSPF